MGVNLHFGRDIWGKGIRAIISEYGAILDCDLLASGLAAYTIRLCLAVVAPRGDFEKPFILPRARPPPYQHPAPHARPVSGVGLNLGEDVPLPDPGRALRDHRRP